MQYPIQCERNCDSPQKRQFMIEQMLLALKVLAWETDESKLKSEGHFFDEGAKETTLTSQVEDVSNRGKMADYERSNGVHGPSDIVFLIHYGEHTIRVELPEADKVGDMKRLLTRKTGLEAGQMELLGWDVPDDLSDQATFADLGIPKEYHLVLQPQSGSNDERISKTYQIQVDDLENDETYNLFFNGMQTVREVKKHVGDLSRIPLDKQNWIGWPWPLHDDQSLYEAGLRTPNQELRVSRTHELSNHNDIVRSPSVRSQNSADLSYDMDEDEVDESDMVDISPRISLRGSLVPDAQLPMSEAVRVFVRNFEQRYGTDHAPFFAGTLREAMSNAFDRPVKERHILAVYVHNDRSISVNIFVTQVLQETVLIDYIRDHVVLWPWDITLPESRAILRNEVEEVLGMQGAIPIVTSAVDKFPMMFICSKIRGSVELLRVVDGSKSAQEVLNAFEFVEEMHSDAQDAEMMDQQARASRAVVVEEQNQAYLASLEADKAKEEAKRAVESQKKEAEDRAKEDVRLRQVRQDQASASLPPEPPQGNGDTVTVIRLRTPDGKSLTRRFLSTDPLKHLYTFAHANGYPQTEYNLVCNYPRKELSGLDSNSSFKDLGLTQQVAVFMEER